MDTDKDGKIDAKELVEAMGAQQQKTAEQILAKYDTNKDGGIDENELNRFKSDMIKQTLKDAAKKSPRPAKITQAKQEKEQSKEQKQQIIKPVKKEDNIEEKYEEPKDEDEHADHHSNDSTQSVGQIKTENVHSSPLTITPNSLGQTVYRMINIQNMLRLLLEQPEPVFIDTYSHKDNDKKTK